VTREQRDRARKIKRQYTEGPLVRVTFASGTPEAELIQGMLLEEGVPSLVRRTGPTAVLAYLQADGPHEVLVAQSALEAAREILLLSE
jgi:hypothetical protein